MIFFWGIIGWVGGVLTNWIVDLIPFLRPTAPAPPSKFIFPRSLLLDLLRRKAGIGRERNKPSPVSCLIVEGASIVILPLFLVQTGGSTAAWQTIILLFLLLVIALVDLKYRLVLNPILVVTVILNFAFIFGQDGGTADVLEALLGGAVAFALFLAADFVSPAKLGGGDIKLAFVIGTMFGFPYLFGPLLVGTSLGALQAVVSLMKGHKKNHLFAYAPGLCIGAAAGLLFLSAF